MLPIDDHFDGVACLVALDLLARGAWRPSFDLDPATCPQGQFTFAVADTVQEVVDMPWVSELIAGPRVLPVGIAVASNQPTSGAPRTIAVLVMCR
jgi:hypothetical protein